MPSDTRRRHTPPHPARCAAGSRSPPLPPPPTPPRPAPDRAPRPAVRSQTRRHELRSGVAPKSQESCRLWVRSVFRPSAQRTVSHASIDGGIQSQATASCHFGLPQPPRPGFGRSPAPGRRKAVSPSRRQPPVNLNAIPRRDVRSLGIRAPASQRARPQGARAGTAGDDRRGWGPIAGRDRGKVAASSLAS